MANLNFFFKLTANNQKRFTQFKSQNLLSDLPTRKVWLVSTKQSCTVHLQGKFARSICTLLAKLGSGHASYFFDASQRRLVLPTRHASPRWFFYTFFHASWLFRATCYASSFYKCVNNNKILRQEYSAFKTGFNADTHAGQTPPLLTVNLHPSWQSSLFLQLTGLKWSSLYGRIFKF